ncbi:tRNA (adenosine(37)-N6)-threonylcarbamoyltransferase complex transferase subunit TsaD, partial [Crocinitomicaceae bacterium]|nr:tRNA (adenosine(37)-N6)-threonylcarbamoyltransferase complex transferase subunit TsaD [Crocinitomicaceae bacterium]
VIVKDYLDMEIVGTTLDDAAGEAFDKAAKMLGFEYPGGPLIDKYAKEGDPERFTFSKPKVDGYNFSFSGLKTAILYFLQAEAKKDTDFIQKNLADLCASIQYTIVSILMKQLKRVAKDYNITDVAIAGGVSANSELRSTLTETGKQLGWNTFIPKFEYCTDNAAMIAIAGRYMYDQRFFADQSIVVQPRAPFTR